MRAPVVAGLAAVNRISDDPICVKALAGLRFRTQAHVERPGGEEDGEVKVIEVEVRLQGGNALEPLKAPGDERAKGVADRVHLQIRG